MLTRECLDKDYPILYHDGEVIVKILNGITGYNPSESASVKKTWLTD